MTTPTKKPRKRPHGFSLIAASNLGLLLGIVLILAGIFSNTEGVIIAGGIVAATAVVLSFVHASRRRARMDR